MYSIQALWSAANQKLPVIFVICNNGGYRILKQRLKAFHGDERFIGMDFKDPTIDLAGLARAFGVQAHRVEDAAAFDATLKEALAGSSRSCWTWSSTGRCDQAAQAGPSACMRSRSARSAGGCGWNPPLCMPF